MYLKIFLDMKRQGSELLLFGLDGTEEGERSRSDSIMIEHWMESIRK